MARCPRTETGSLDKQAYNQISNSLGIELSCVPSVGIYRKIVKVLGGDLYRFRRGEEKPWGGSQKRPNLNPISENLGSKNCQIKIRWSNPDREVVILPPSLTGPWDKVLDYRTSMHYSKLARKKCEELLEQSGIVLGRKQIQRPAHLAKRNRRK